MSDLRNFIVWLWFASMDDIGELHRILDEENGNVVSNNVPIALVRVKLDCEATNITDRISGATATQHGREANENGGLARGIGKDAGRSNIRRRLEKSKLSVSTCAAGVDNALWDALMVEAVDLSMSIRCQKGWTGSELTFSRPNGSSSSIGPVLSSLTTPNQWSVLFCFTP